MRGIKLRFSDEAVVEGRRDEAREVELREARVAAARRQPGWVEFEETALVRRARWLVHAESDELYRRSRGVVFQSGSAALIADHVPLAFYVEHETGEVVFLEKVGKTWSEIVARRAGKAAR